MKIRIATGVLFGAAFLTACDQVEITAHWNPPALSLQDESPAGIYQGTFTDTSGDVPRVLQATAIIDVDGNVQIIFPADPGRHVAGRVDVAGDRVTGALTEYSGAFAAFTGTSGAGNFALRGTVSAGTSISGLYTADAHAGRFTLDYRAVSDAASALALTAGVWSYGNATAGGDMYAGTWEIDAGGVVFGTDTLGCVFVGRVSAGDPSLNVYDISIQVDACGYFDGDYSGQAFLGSAGGEEPGRLTLGMANDVLAFAAEMQQ